MVAVREHKKAAGNHAQALAKQNHGFVQDVERVQHICVPVVMQSGTAGENAR